MSTVAGPVLIVVPVLGRPRNVEPLLTSVEAATPEPHRVLFVADETDVDEIDAIEAAGGNVLVVPKRRISYPCKVNSAYLKSSEPLLFLAADDVRFHPGWLPAATAQLSDTIHVVGTQDMGNPRVLAGTHSTHTLVTRAYCDDPGASADKAKTVLHEGYRHWYCDDELVGVAKARGAFAFAADSVVEHLHPFFGKAEKDSTYQAGQMASSSDRRKHARRQALWT